MLQEVLSCTCTLGHACMQELSGLDRGAFVAYSSPEKPDGFKGNVGAIVGICLLAVALLGFLVFLSSRRRRGHAFKRDAWGLPLNPVVRALSAPLMHFSGLRSI